MFVFGDPEIKVVGGGMRWHSCLIMPGMGGPLIPVLCGLDIKWKILTDASILLLLW